MSSRAPKVAGRVCQSVFLRRSYQIYSGMEERAKKQHIASLPFALEDFRDWLLEKFSGRALGVARCEYSGEIITAENFSVDHRLPLSRGGGFAIANLALCSENQNLRKGNMSEVEYGQFKQHVDRYSPEVQAAIWRKLEVGDVQRFSYYRRENKKKARV